MTGSDDPRVLLPVLRLVRLSQIGLQPLVLNSSVCDRVDRLLTVRVPVVELGAKGDHMDGANVEAVEVVIVLARLLVDHRVAVGVVGEVSGSGKFKIKNFLYNFTVRQKIFFVLFLPVDLVVAHHRLVGHVGHRRLHLAHVLVADVAVVLLRTTLINRLAFLFVRQFVF